MKKVCSATTLCILALLIAFSRAEIYSLDLNNAEMSQLARTKAVSLKVGDYLNITIRENPSTGFKWLF